ncbi:hypothetical protein T4E_4803 [Trichinella pseudospiralis]|uniref:Accumulation-associated protein n=1 Tax=Trichinella pseudospiralis TaxID=6337 RepID=A0A0V0XY39_TRIPS|nr:hypothetical protein T4E_4803 [Trichinella pseudospiralis]
MHRLYTNTAMPAWLVLITRAAPGASLAGGQWSQLPLKPGGPLGPAAPGIPGLPPGPGLPGSPGGPRSPEIFEFLKSTKA